MNNKTVALLFGLGLAGWVYSIMMRRTGSQTKTSLIAAAGAGLVGAFVLYTLFAMVFPPSDNGF